MYVLFVPVSGRGVEKRRWKSTRGKVSDLCRCRGTPEKAFLKWSQESFPDSGQVLGKEGRELNNLLRALDTCKV